MVRTDRQLALSIRPPFVYNTVMAKSNPVKQRKRGPKPTGVNPIMAFRPQPKLRADIEAHAKAGDTSVSEALRDLVELGLAAKGNAR